MTQPRIPISDRLPSRVALALALGLSACSGQTTLATEDAGADARMRTGPYDECGNGMDDDGDGQIDEGCFCGGGETQPCFTGTHPNRGVGACADGVQMCDAVGSTEFGHWGACAMDTLPTEEACDGVDNDCDGAIDEGCSCSAGDMRACATEYRTAPCAAGTQTCQADGTWSGCEGAVGPSAEACGSDGRGDGIDNDCDGERDEGCTCVPEPEVCDDGIDNDCDGRVDEPVCSEGDTTDAGTSRDAGSGDAGDGDSGRCHSASDCPGELCDYLTGACVPRTPDRCVVPPSGGGTQGNGEGCNTRYPCADGLVCVRYSQVLNPETGEYGFATEEPDDQYFTGMCLPACDPCDGTCPDGDSCFALPSGGGFCAPRLIGEGELCSEEGYGPIGPCAGGLHCPPPSQGLGGISEYRCQRLCVPQDEELATTNAAYPWAASAAECEEGQVCRQNSVSSRGNNFACVPGRLAPEGGRCGMGEPPPYCQHPNHCLNTQIVGAGVSLPAVPGICGRGDCRSTGCPAGAHCRHLIGGLEGELHICVGEHEVAPRAICAEDLDCEVGYSCRPIEVNPSSGITTCQRS